MSLFNIAHSIIFNIAHSIIFNIAHSIIFFFPDEDSKVTHLKSK